MLTLSISSEQGVGADFRFRVLINDHYEVNKCHPHCSKMTQAMFCDDDFDFDALLDDDFLSMSAPPVTTFGGKPTEKGEPFRSLCSESETKNLASYPQVHRSPRLMS